MTLNLQQLCADGPVLTDGAWGTELQRRGLPVGAMAEPWNIDNPDPIREIAGAYARAGAQVLLTNSFRGNRIAMESAGVKDPEHISQLNQSAPRLTREGLDAVGINGLVAATIGPSGLVLMEHEDDLAPIEAAFYDQACDLEIGGADILVVETMAQVDEMEMAVRAAKAATKLPVIACMSYDTANGERTSFGVTAQQHADAATAAGADGIGANCGLGVEQYVDVTRRLREATDLPLWIRPNAGLPVMEGGEVTYKSDPGSFAAKALALVDAGAGFIGGCCGTSPAHIEALAKALGKPVP